MTRTPLISNWSCDDEIPLPSRQGDVPAGLIFPPRLIIVGFLLVPPIAYYVIFSQVMFMGVVAKTVESENFDGNFFLERVTNYEEYNSPTTGR